MLDAGLHIRNYTLVVAREAEQLQSVEAKCIPQEYICVASSASEAGRVEIVLGLLFEFVFPEQTALIN